MRRILKLVAVLGVVGYAMAAKGTIKSKLAQQDAKTLAQVQGIDLGAPDCGCADCDDLPFGWELPGRTPDDCTCEVPPVLSGPPPPEDHQHNSSETRINTETTLYLADVPDTAYEATEEHACCSCENAVHDTYQNATKIRRFNIDGEICVTESICYAESSNSEEASSGRSTEEIDYWETPSDSGLGAGPGCRTVTVCPPDVVAA